MELITIRVDDEHEGNIHRLYEASMRGCVSTLNTLIQNDPLIFHKTSLPNSFKETPLHISALFGHLDFTKAILEAKPELAKELDSFQRSPLHLASAEGHDGDVVRELLLANNDACLVADQGGRIPLHLAMMRGRSIEVIKELVRARPVAIFVQLNGDTVLHLCVKYNHLEALKVLVPLVGDHEEFLNSKDHEGYTILELSAMLKQLQTTSYLLSVPQIRVDVNSLIQNGFAPSEIIPLDASGNDSGESTSQQAIVASTNRTRSPPQRAIVASTTHIVQTPSQNDTQRPAESSPSTNFNHFQNHHQDDWYQKLCGYLMVVATLIAAMSFQVSTNPPGGSLENGVSVLAASINSKSSYYDFLISSTISFSASLTIILIIASGIIPRRKKNFAGLLTVLMLIAVRFIADAYISAVGLIQMPNDPTFEKIMFYFNTYLSSLVNNLGGILALEALSSWLPKKLNVQPTRNQQQPRVNIV